MIFISHSSKDRETALAVHSALSGWGYPVFLDFHRDDGLPAGVDWKHRLYRELRAASAVIAVWSRHSAASRWCIAEITFADAQGKPLIPITVDDQKDDAVLFERQALPFADLPRLKDDLIKLGLGESAAWDEQRCPYPGMRAFDRDDAAVFFGRDAETRRGVEHITRLRRVGGPRFLVAIGPSGSGKSSLLRAGWLPKLARDERSFLVVDPFRPGRDPAAWAAHALCGAARSFGAALDEAELRVELAGPRARDTLARAADALRRAASRPDATIVVSVDQLEELFVTDPSAARAPVAARAAAHPFLRALAEITADARAAVLVVGTLRSDLLATFQRAAESISLGYDALLVEPLSAVMLKHVIRGPARAARLDIHDDLVDALCAETATGDALPLLANALNRLWNAHGRSGWETRAALDAVGGVRGSIEKDAEALIEPIANDVRVLSEVRRAFVAFVRIDEDQRRVRRVARWEDLPPAALPTLERFAAPGVRLLVRDVGPDGDVAYVAHEALFDAWGRLRCWIEESRAHLAALGSLRRDAEAWRAAGRAPSFTWRGQRLADAATLPDGDLCPLEQAFLRASHDAEAAQRTERIAGLVSTLRLAEQRLAALDEEEDDVEFSPRLDAAARRGAYERITAERAAKLREAAELRAEITVLRNSDKGAAGE